MGESLERVDGVGTCIIVLKQENGVDSVLLLKRLGSHGAGSWSVPGGWLDRWEASVKDSAIRELREEVGDELETSDPFLVAVTNDVFSQEDIHCVTLWYVCDWVSGEPQLMEPDKASEIGWFAADQLPTPLFLPLENYLEGRVVE